MKRLLIFALFILSALSASAQSERVFVVTDRQTYIAGDRVWCSLFCLDEKGLLSGRSSVAYLELVSTADCAAEAKISLLNGRGAGEFLLPGNLPTGNYRLMAYTALEGAGNALEGSRLLSVYNTSSIARVPGGVITGEKAPSVALDEVSEGISIVCPGKVRQGKSFTAMISGISSDISVSVYHTDGLEQCLAEPMAAFKNCFPLAGSGGTVEYDGEIIHGNVQNATPSTACILSSAGSPGDTYVAFVEEDGSVHFPTGNIFGDREMVCAVMESGENVRIRLESPFMHPSAGDIPALKLDREQYSALIRRKDALSTYYAADTLVQFLPRRSDLLLSGVSWKKYHLDDYTRFPTIKEVAVEILPEVRIRGERLEVAVHDGTSSKSVYKDYVLTMMDGVVIPDLSLIMDFDAMLIEDVLVCTQPLVLGTTVFNGIVNFVTKKNYVTALNFPESVCVLNFKGVSYPVAYPGTVPSGRDTRELLYWHPLLELKAGEPLRLNLTAPSYSGRFCAIAEGLSDDGKPLRCVTYFEVDN